SEGYNIEDALRTTAAAQSDEDEVAEVDEAAFQDLRNYDENPQGIRLPEDQYFALDDEGNIYYRLVFDGAPVFSGAQGGE
ncbi:MAG: hypothetical protein OEZ23_02285, partial [Gammaproteobacteria bacterium]|nr:hypothetical protein [Gammaproteobacteria bacterium]